MTLKISTSLVVLAVFSFISTVSALENVPDANNLRTLSDYLQYAALHNAALEANFHHFKAALEQVPQAKSLPDPKFTYGYFIREVETRVGPQEQKFGIMQVFPWFGTIEARADSAAAQAKAAKKRYDAEKLKLFWKVKEAFYEYVYLASAVEIAKQNLELLKHFEEVARTRYAAATGGHPDVIRAQVELAKLEDILKSLEKLREPTVARLNAVLNRQSSEMLGWPEKEEFKLPKVDGQKVITILRQTNPELAAIDFEVAEAQSKVELAKRKFYPDIGVGVEWIETGSAAGSGVSGSGEDPLVLMFSMNLPIWTDSYKAAERQAQSNVIKARQQRTEAENTILARAEQVLYDFEDSNRKIRLYADVLIPKADELLEASEGAYRGGTVDFLSLVDAQRMKLDFQLKYERAVTNSRQKLAELEMLAGTEVSTMTD
jgi:cobalt-zinc-cadmium efflux system outer membrane protein